MIPSAPGVLPLGRSCRRRAGRGGRLFPVLCLRAFPVVRGLCILGHALRAWPHASGHGRDAGRHRRQHPVRLPSHLRERRLSGARDRGSRVGEPALHVRAVHLLRRHPPGARLPFALPHDGLAAEQEGVLGAPSLRAAQRDPVLHRHGGIHRVHPAGRQAGPQRACRDKPRFQCEHDGIHADDRYRDRRLGPCGTGPWPQ